jgi:hypothetical protein
MTAATASSAPSAVEYMFTPATPPDVCALLRYMYADRRAPVPRELRVRYASQTMHLLCGCRWLGGGSDGFVLQIGRRVVKVREITTDHCLRFAAREIVAGTLARLLAMPHVAPLAEWRLWAGEDSGLCARSMATAISAQIAGSPRVHDFIEMLPDRDVRTRAYAHWCASHSAEFKRERRELVRALSAPQYAAHIEGQYARQRAAYLHTLERPHAFAVLTMPLGGQRTMFAMLMADTTPWDRRWVSPRMWPVMRAHLCVLAHTLYALQMRYAFMHSDLNMSNIVLADARDLPAALRTMWLPADPWPSAAHVTPGAGVTLRDLDGMVPTIIDLSLATVDYRLAADTLGIAQNARTAPAARSLLDRRQQYSRTTDLRRLGLYLAYALASTCHHLVAPSRQGPPDAQRWLHTLRERVDRRFAIVAVAMTTVSAQWAELVRGRPELAADAFRVPSKLPVDRRTPTFGGFVANVRAVQRYLRSVLQLLDPERRPNAEMHREAGALWPQHRLMMDALEVLVVDLNPHMDYVQRMYEAHERADDPLLPENVLRWLPPRDR